MSNDRVPVPMLVFFKHNAIALRCSKNKHDMPLGVLESFYDNLSDGSDHPTAHALIPPCHPVSIAVIANCRTRSQVLPASTNVCTLLYNRSKDMTTGYAPAMSFWGQGRRWQVLNLNRDHTCFNDAQLHLVCYRLLPTLLKPRPGNPLQGRPREQRWVGLCSGIWGLHDDAVVHLGALCYSLGKRKPYKLCFLDTQGYV